ncbi:MAG: High-affinity branched-chain amino acid transport ATP-binding protein LivF [Anaerolineae bacterium]|nr:High-affinity branched-chain amino acid transport ATP-binding protein LivF [Anaerolineae bacterium]
MLHIRDLHTHYGHVHALRGVSIDIQEGEIVTLIGNNGAGKSTLLNTISGLVPVTSGTIEFMGQNISFLSSEAIVKAGIAQAPEGRRVFPRSSVMENLEMGAFIRKDAHNVHKDIEAMMDRFPILRERRKQMAGTLSGGEQQMLTIARALMSRPKLLMLDEPSLGLMPTIVQDIFKLIREIHSEEGTTILLVEQNARKALAVADNAYVLETGEVVLQGSAEELQKSDQVRKAYLGEGSTSKYSTRKEVL